MWPTPDPKVSEVVAALETINPEVENPFVILNPPESEDGSFTNYCKVLAHKLGYVCEIRIFDGDDFLQK